MEDVADIKIAIDQARGDTNSPTENALLDICDALLNIVANFQCEFCDELGTDRHLDYRTCSKHLPLAIDNVASRGFS